VFDNEALYVRRQTTVPPILASLDHLKGIFNENVWTGVLKEGFV